MAPTTPPRTTVDELRVFVRAHGASFLDDPNVTSVGVGLKQVDGVTTDQVSVQFSVARKLAPDQLEAAGTARLPEHVTVAGETVPTDVVERRFTVGAPEGGATTQAGPYAVAEAEDPERTRRHDPVVPGISLAHVEVSAGTFGCVVYDADDATPYALSNWHVLNGPTGAPGDTVVQPGPHDDPDVEANHLGVLVRSHLGLAGDAAICTLSEREHATAVLQLGVTPSEYRRAELGDRVVKSGRTTGVTRGIVTRVETIVEIDYGPGAGVQRIGGFEIGVDAASPAPGGEISMGGDSGSVWLLRSDAGRTTGTATGLHFGGEAGASDDEHALACDLGAVMERLKVTLSRREAEQARRTASEAGYDPAFLTVAVPPPALTGRSADDIAPAGGPAVLTYTHFSLTMSASRRLAHWVAWNIDGASLLRLDRRSLKFRLDPRLPAEAQLGDAIYAANDLDRGHLARRSDLTWGPPAEAERANADSFHFTNIAPQRSGFNQSGAQGIWGRLEDALYEQVSVDGLRVSAFAGPVLDADDPTYRGVQIPRSFWKVLAWVGDGRLQARAFVLTQDLRRLETLDLDAFATYQVTLAEVERRTSVRLPAALSDAEPASVREAIDEPCRLASLDEIRW